MQVRSTPHTPLHMQCFALALFLTPHLTGKGGEFFTFSTSAVQNGSLMARFAAPICWNFYHIIRFAKDNCKPEAQAAGQCESAALGWLM